LPFFSYENVRDNIIIGQYDNFIYKSQLYLSFNLKSNFECLKELAEIVSLPCTEGATSYNSL